jgi:hypothetical protein
MFVYPIYHHNWRNISTICIYITRLASNEIFSPSNEIHLEIGRGRTYQHPGRRYRDCMMMMMMMMMVFFKHLVTRSIFLKFQIPIYVTLSADFRQYKHNTVVSVYVSIYCCANSSSYECVFWCNVPRAL